MKEPAVFYYVMGDTKDAQAPGNEWRSADAWPVPATATPFCFHKDGRLAAAKPTTSGDFREYTFDPNAINRTTPTYDTINVTTKLAELGDVVHFTFFAQEKAPDGKAYWSFVRLIIRGNTVHYTR